jgi:hypothetical protein
LINGEARDLSKHRPGEPMTLGNMRELGVQRLVAYCLNDAGAAGVMLCLAWHLSRLADLLL